MTDTDHAEPLSRLEARVQRTEDLLEIHQLFIDYGRHLDAGRFAEYARLFARDGVLRLGPLGSASGPDEIEALMTRTLDGSVGQTFHVISSPVVHLDGDAATSEVMWTMIRRGTDGVPEVAMLGRHRDQLVREDGRWRIRERRGLIDVPSTYPGAAPAGG